MSLQSQAKPSTNVDNPFAVIVQLLNDGKREWQNIKDEMSRIGTNLECMKENHEKLTSRVFQIEDWSRRAFTKATVKTFVAVIKRYYKGHCPCCGEQRILNDNAVKTASFELDHYKGPNPSL